MLASAFITFLTGTGLPTGSSILGSTKQSHGSNIHDLTQKFRLNRRQWNFSFDGPRVRDCRCFGRPMGAPYLSRNPPVIASEASTFYLGELAAMTQKLLVLTSVSSGDEARKIARGLLERRLAACVNIVPRVDSLYWWEGKLESSEELLVLIKTVKRHEEAVPQTIRELHSYQLPECIAIEIGSGSPEYLEWIEDSVS